MEQYGAVRALQFIPLAKGVCQAKYNTEIDKFPPFRASAVIVSGSSGVTQSIASILGTFKIPVLSPMATSEEVLIGIVYI